MNLRNNLTPAVLLTAAMAMPGCKSPAEQRVEKIDTQISATIAHCNQILDNRDTKVEVAKNGWIAKSGTFPEKCSCLEYENQNGKKVVDCDFSITLFDGGFLKKYGVMLTPNSLIRENVYGPTSGYATPPYVLTIGIDGINGNCQSTENVAGDFETGEVAIGKEECDGFLQQSRYKLEDLSQKGKDMLF